MAGRPAPTVASVYAGTGNRDRWSVPDLWETSALNGQLLAARGHAVLNPSLPYDEVATSREPMENLAGLTLAAVDAVIAAGCIDPDRLAIRGQSFGGSATMSVSSQTDRFKAVITQAGIYDLISLYAEMRPIDRLSAEFNGPSSILPAPTKPACSGSACRPGATPAISCLPPFSPRGATSGRGCENVRRPMMLAVARKMGCCN